MSDVTLHLGDCLEEMKAIPDGSIDLILADLPYGATRNCWDQVIPLKPLWDLYRRLLKPRGAVVLTSSQPFTSALVASNPRWFRYEWILEKQKGSDPLNARRKPMKSHENILVFSPGKTTYNPQMRLGLAYASKGDCRVKSQNFGHAGEKIDPGNPSGDRFPVTVLRFQSEGMNSGSLHPTQKPVALMEYLIRTYTDEGATVLDNCFGSCTTGVAAINTGRRFIGIEKDAGYFEIGRNRIAEHRAALSETLFA